eukprot:scaffold5479_cov199-Amphora_coffeaeformis.AAC.4
MADNIMSAMSEVNRLAMMRSSTVRFRRGWCKGNRSVREGDREGNRRLFSPPTIGKMFEREDETQEDRSRDRERAQLALSTQHLALSTQHSMVLVERHSTAQVTVNATE